jgi:hypothetical protein
MTVNALQAVLDKASKGPPRAEVPARPRAKAERPASAEKRVAAPEPVAEKSARKFHRPSRDNRRFVGGHFDPAVGKQLRMIAVEDETTVQALLEEALDLLFVKKGRQKIADLAK